MLPSTLAISEIGPESDRLLRNLCEHYVYDMSEWFQIDTEADGSYSYDTATIWKGGYHVYLAKAGDVIAGFAIVGPAAGWLGDSSAHDVHEFFILRRFRRNGFGQQFAAQLWGECRGEWLVRVLEANTPAVHFWRAAIGKCGWAGYSEEIRIVNGQRWRFLRFQSA